MTVVLGSAGDMTSSRNKAEVLCLKKKLTSGTAGRVGENHQFPSGQQASLSLVILDLHHDRKISQPNRQEIILNSKDL